MDIASILELGSWTWKRMHARKVLLVVEDNADDVLLLREELKSTKFGYVIVRSAEEAIGTLRTNKFHAALIDIGLPGMGGHELAKKVQDEHPKMRVFFITGSSFINLDAGQLIRVIRKPVTAKSLRDMTI